MGALSSSEITLTWQLPLAGAVPDASSRVGVVRLGGEEAGWGNLQAHLASPDAAFEYQDTGSGTTHTLEELQPGSAYAVVVVHGGGRSEPVVMRTAALGSGMYTEMYRVS